MHPLVLDARGARVIGVCREGPLRSARPEHRRGARRENYDMHMHINITCAWTCNMSN